MTLVFDDMAGHTVGIQDDLNTIFHWDCFVEILIFDVGTTNVMYDGIAFTCFDSQHAAHSATYLLRRVRRLGTACDRFQK